MYPFFSIRPLGSSGEMTERARMLLLGMVVYPYMNATSVEGICPQTDGDYKADKTHYETSSP
jgi:hypothetical protein